MPQAKSLAVFAVLLFATLGVGAWAFSLPQPPVGWEQTTVEEYSPQPLRGFGTIGGQTLCWTAGSGVEVWITRLDCESADHASLTLSKYLGDLTSRGQVEERQVNWPEGQVTVHTLSGYGLVLAAQVGEQVLIVGSESPNDLRAACRHLKLLEQSPVFTPQTLHPAWLDTFQRYAVNSFWRPLARLNEEDDWDRRFDFCQQYSVGMLPHIDWGHFEIEDGTFDFSQFRWVEANAMPRGIAFTQMLLTEHMPLWLVNLHPEWAIRRDPQTHLATWDTWDSPGNRHASPAREEPYAYTARWIKTCAEWAQRNPMLTGYYLGDGWPGGESAYHGWDTQMYDYSQNGQESFRDFLRNKGLSLAELGQRWYDNSGHFRSWDEVMLPSWTEVVGYGPGVLDLAEGWRWQGIGDWAEVPESGWFEEEVDDRDWTAMASRASVENLLLPKAPALLRCKFDAPAEWTTEGDQDVYLCAQLWTMLPGGRTDIPLYLNGRLLRPVYLIAGDLKPMNFAVNVTSVLYPGENTLALATPQGHLYGPVFLRRGLPSRYPYLGRGLNQRWCDFRDWQDWHLLHGTERVLKALRAVDPNPLVIIPGLVWASAGEITTRLMEQYGVSGEFSGSPAFLFPWHKGLGYLYGRPGGTEEGGTNDDLQQQAKQLGWLLIMAHQKYHQFWHVENLYWPDEKLAFFKENQPIYKAFGKFDWAPPQVALLKSSLTHRYLMDVRQEPPYSFDVGRGELQSLGLTNVYVTEWELRNGRVNDYPVLWDCGSQIMSDEVVHSLEKYVRAGGTFVAIHLTGQHSPTEPDSWPISRLTGFQVKGQRRGTKLTLADDCWLLPRHRGQTFISEGVSIDWLNVNRIGRDLALDPQAEGVRALATWEDGSIAIGERRLGKGRVIVLGSTFWRGAQDLRGVWISREEAAGILDDMMDGLGIYRPVRYDDRRLWMADCITNDGRDRWLIAFNTSFDDSITPTIRIACPDRPARIADVVSGQELPSEWVNGEAVISAQSMAPLQKWILQIKRANLGAAVPYWFRFQCKYWDKLPETKLPPLPETNSLDLWQNWRFHLLPGTTAEQAGDTDWAQPGFDDSTWPTIDLGIWQTQGYEEQGLGRYRKTFTVPPGWEGKRIFLWAAGYEWGVWRQQGRMYLNGELLWDWLGGNSFPRVDITDRLQPGENLLALEIDGHDPTGLSGLVGTVALYTRPNWAAQFELRGEGMEYGASYRPRQAVPVPGPFSGQALAVNFTLPKEWQGKRVWLQVDTGLHAYWVTVVIFNNQQITRFHPTGNLFEWMISSDANFGGPNRLILLTWAGMGYREDQNVPVEALRLLVEEPVSGEPRMLPPS